MRLSEWPLIVMNYFSHVWNSLQECLLLLNTGTTHLTRQDMWREVNRRHGQHPTLTLFVRCSHIFTPHQQWEGSEVFNLEGGVGKAEAFCHGDVEEWHHCQTKGILTFSVLLPRPGSLKAFIKTDSSKILRQLKLNLWKSPQFTCKTALDLDTSKIEEHFTGWKWKETTWTFNLAGSHRM